MVAYLDGGGMGPEHDVGGHVEGILHVPGGVVLGHVEGFEIVILELDVRPLGNRKAEGRKDRDNLVEDERDGVALCRGGVSFRGA